MISTHFILYNQRDATYTAFFIIIIISALHVSGGFFTHHHDLTKLYVQPWVLSWFPAVYRWCGWVGTVQLLAKSDY
jgi:lipopolysaccharide export LptBFGC system permease protein LptF